MQYSHICCTESRALSKCESAQSFGCRHIGEVRSCWPHRRSCSFSYIWHSTCHGCLPWKITTHRHASERVSSRAALDIWLISLKLDSKSQCHWMLATVGKWDLACWSSCVGDLFARIVYVSFIAERKTSMTRQRRFWITTQLCLMDLRNLVVACARTQGVFSSLLFTDLDVTSLGRRESIDNGVTSQTTRP